MATIRQMTPHDLPAAMRLKEAAGWNQLDDDWRDMLAWSPAGCLVAEVDGEIVGTTILCPTGSIGWLAMVLVAPTMRGQGVGTQLVDAAMRLADDWKLPGVLLEATPLGEPVYRKFGFEVQRTTWVMTGLLTNEDSAAPDLIVEPIARAASMTLSEQSAWDWFLDRDCRSTGVDRRVILDCWRRRPTYHWRIVRRGHDIIGFFGHRPGAHFVRLGPVLADRPEDALSILDLAALELVGRSIVMLVPDTHPTIKAWGLSHGLGVQRELKCMAWRTVPPVDASLLFVPAGAELG